MAEALYRKYRSRQLEEVTGQEHITRTLTNALKAGKISHAYLLTGPRGVGKTSVARILAHEFNALPYKDDAAHLDIIEIDAASNRRIDEIRDLRDKVNVAPTSAKYKVYIIDEVHMLTKEAFNALLKTLEEPPAHVIFILATTEAHKLPETIVSRTQRFTFKPIDVKEAKKHLKKMAEQEKIDIDNESLELIAQHGLGSLRDSISLLDQLAGNKKIKPSDVLEALGVVPALAIADLASSLEHSSAKELLEKLDELRLKGYAAPQIAKQLSENLREEVITQKSNLLLNLLKNLLGVPASSEPEQLLELLLLEYQLKLETNQPANQKNQSTKQLPVEVPITTAKPARNIKLSDNTWKKILAEVKLKHNTLYSILRMSDPIFSQNTLTLTFKFPFHQKQIMEPKNMNALKAIAAQYLPGEFTVKCQTKATQAPKSGLNGQKIETISNIFGGAEVLE